MLGPGLDSILREGKQRACFICGQLTGENESGGVHLQSGRTSHSQTHLPLKLGQLIGDDFFVIVSVEDRICVNCITLVDHVDQLETELSRVKTLITDKLKNNYNLADSLEDPRSDYAIDDVKSNASCKKINILDQVATLEEKLSAKVNNVAREIKITSRNVSCNKSFEFQGVLKKENLCISNVIDSFQLLGNTSESVDHLGNCEDNLNSEEQEVASPVVEHRLLNSWDCGVCHVNIKNISDINSHIKTHQNDDDCKVREFGLKKKPISLNECVEEFKFDDLDANMRNPLNDCKESVLKSFSAESKQDSLDCLNKLSNFQCENCSATLLDKESLISHLSNASCVESQIANKLNSGTVFFSSSLNSSAPTIDALPLQEDETYQCLRCSVRFNGVTSYLGHVCSASEKKHSEEPQFEVYFTDINQIPDLALTPKDSNLDVDCVNTLFFSHETGENSSSSANIDNITSDIKDIPTIRQHHYVSRDNFNIDELNDSKLSFEKFKNCISEKDNAMNQSVLKEFTSISTVVDNASVSNNVDYLISSDRDPTLEQNSSNNFLCECSFITSSPQEFRTHSTQCSNFFRCSVCKMYIEKLLKEDHMEKHRVLACDIGSFKTKNRSDSNRNKPKQSSCRFCSVTFRSSKNLEKHENAHPESFAFKCSKCSRIYRKQTQLEKHEEQVHREKVCRVCGKEISNLRSLRDHERGHARRLILVCKVCGREFKTKTGLSHHMARHTGKFKYFCEFCERGFMSRMMLEEHRSKHTKEERYVCDVCGRKFSFQSTLWIHRKWHSTPYPYKCDVCARMFRHTSLLAVHRRKHTGERPYRCQHCPASFAVSSTLKRHLILHTRDFPFTCDKCHARFTTRHKFVAHLAKAHNSHELLTKQQPANKLNYKMAVRDKTSPDSKDSINEMQERLETPAPVFEIIQESPLQQIAGPLSETTNILPDMWCQ